jgi:hypothetical protein
MKLICRIFGHHIKEYSYGKYWGGVVDGIGREHGYYFWECKRCHQEVSLYVHFPTIRRDPMDERVIRD